MTGTTLDTGALIALESGSRRMAVLVEEALASRAEVRSLLVSSRRRGEVVQ